MTSDSPIRFIGAARDWAENGTPPGEHLIAELDSISRPMVTNRRAAREHLCGILAGPHCGPALTWLDETGLLSELLPAWAGDETRRRYRLETGERVCNGAWSIGVSDEAVRRIRTRHKESEISGGNGWNLTLLATLLLSGDLDTDTHAGLVQEDLEALGLTARRIEWVTTPIREYPPLLRCFLTGIIPQVSYSATTIVGTLSSMSADRRIPEEIRTTAGLIAGDMILGV